MAKQIREAKDLGGQACKLEAHHRESAPDDESYGLIASAAARYATNAVGPKSSSKVLVMGAAGGGQGKAIERAFDDANLPAPQLHQVDLICDRYAPTSQNPETRIYGVDPEDNWPLDSVGDRVTAESLEIVVARHML